MYKNGLYDYSLLQKLQDLIVTSPWYAERPDSQQPSYCFFKIQWEPRSMACTSEPSQEGMFYQGVVSETQHKVSLD